VSSRASFLLARPFSRPIGPRAPLELLTVVVVGVASGYAVVHIDNPLATIGVFMAICFAGLGAMRPALFLGLFLLTRPLLDDLGEQHVGVLNAAGALGVLLVFVLLVRLVTAERQMRPVGAGAFGAVLLVSAVACVPAYLDFSSRVGSKPMGEIVRLAAMFGVYVLGCQLFASPRRLINLFTIVGLSGVGPAILGIKEMIIGVPKASGLDISRISGPFTGPNPFGLYLAMTALVLLALPRRALPLWVRLISLGVILTALVATYSRAGWSFFLIGFVLMMWRRNAAVMGLGLVVIVSLVFMIPSIHDRVLPPPDPKTSLGASGVTTPESYTFRIDNWKSLLGKWVDRPITGYGLQTTIYANPRLGYDPTGTADPSGYEAHNTVVKLLVEGGIVLLVAWIGLIFTVTARMRSLSRRDWPFSQLARVVLYLWIATIVIGLGTDDPLAATAMMYGLFALTGAVEGAYRMGRRSSHAPAANASAPGAATPTRI
jgi:O-antigen ligase